MLTLVAISPTGYADKHKEQILLMHYNEIISTFVREQILIVLAAS